MAAFAWSDALGSVARGENLDEDTAAAAMGAMMSGAASPAQIAGFLIGLRAKGETIEEITGLARVMREMSLRVTTDRPTIDTCGTGGDRLGTANISTMAALAVAGAGVAVAKHGNRAASSHCGSADLLEALGVELELAPEGVAACIEEAGIGFCFAPAFHPAMRHVAPVRKELGIPTVFNFLGPLTNPARAPRQTVGVSDLRMAPLIAEALRRLGSQRALVFRGEDGLDELSTTAPSRVWAVDGAVEESTVDATDVGIARATLPDLCGGDAGTNARIAQAVLGGEEGAISNAVALNAGAAIMVAGAAAGLAEGIERARESLRSGAAARALDRMREVSQRVKQR